MYLARVRISRSKTKMRNLQLQAPHRDQTSANRRSKASADLYRNSNKGARKSLNPVFKDEIEDDSSVLESLKEFSETSDDNPFSESAENFFASVHPSDTVAVSDVTSIASSSVTATPFKHVAFDTANTKNTTVDSFKMTESLDAEFVIKHLKEARVQILKSKDVGSSKKLVEALINISIEEIHGGLYEESEWFDKLLSRRSSLAFLISIMGIFPLLMVWFLKWSSEGSSAGPTPT